MPNDNGTALMEGIFHKDAQILSGQLQAVLRLFLGDKIEMGGLCGFELLQQSLCRLAHKIFKKRGLIRVIAVKGAFREACLRDDLIQRCVLEALLQKFFFPSFEDLLLSLCTFHGRLLIYR